MTWNHTNLALDALKSDIVFATSLWVLFWLAECIRNVYFHPLSKFPGPRLAAASSWWSTYQQTIFHFNHPEAYSGIYRTKFDKDPFMYALLGGDGATVTFVKHQDNKNRKDILHPLFSKSSVYNREQLIQENASISYLILWVPEWVGLTFFKSGVAFAQMKNVRLTSLSCRQMFVEQIGNIRANVGKPSPDETPIIYGAFTDPENYNLSRPPPSRASLMEEAIALVIAGTETTGATMTLGTYHLCKYPEKYARLKAELKETSVIKEALRMAPTTTSENSRLVPPHGAKIGGVEVPGNTIVSMGILFPMQHPWAFENPDQYIPERWLNYSRRGCETEA
ncbi:hypothetical protein CSAL01_06767 [Colletotrichum salicis]|uniref:Cytochrome P450 n=1 Tax=Colletotrichum salicis TaxID=1209931 RepID=A0A135U581_9PEZI|nr:hypothetical protein CSAL01_06767 [Colletotrichum salicis]